MNIAKTYQHRNLHPLVLWPYFGHPKAFGSCLNPVTMTPRGGERSRYEIGAREIFSLLFSTPMKRGFK